MSENDDLERLVNYKVKECWKSSRYRMEYDGKYWCLLSIIPTYCYYKQESGKKMLYCDNKESFLRV